jgi:hypothetical protein
MTHASDIVYGYTHLENDNPHPGVPELFEFTHSGNFSGSVIMNVECWRIRDIFGSTDRNGHKVVAVQIPFDVLAQLVAEAVLQKKIDDLEGADHREILGLK